MRLICPRSPHSCKQHSGRWRIRDELFWRGSVISKLQEHSEAFKKEREEVMGWMECNEQSQNVYYIPTRAIEKRRQKSDLGLYRCLRGITVPRMHNLADYGVYIERWNVECTCLFSRQSPGATIAEAIMGSYYMRWTYSGQVWITMCRYMYVCFSFHINLEPPFLLFISTSHSATKSIPPASMTSPANNWSPR